MGVRAWILAGLLVMSGCGYREAMSRAEEASARKDWAAAAAAYEAALRHDPEDAEAARALADVQRRWHVQSLSRFEKAIQRGDLDGAGEALRQAEAARPAAETNGLAQSRLDAAIKARQAEALRRRGDAELTDARPDAALKTFAEAEAISPTAESAAGVTRSTAALVERSRAAEAIGAWARALADREAIVAVDPSAAGERDALRSRWVAAWSTEGAAHEAAGRLASAFVRAAQLARLDPSDPALGARRDALRARLMTPLLLRREVALTGPELRVQRASSALPPARSIDPASPELRIAGDLAPIRCDQAELVEVRSQRYQSGVRIVRNPEWVDARQAVRRARDARADAERRQHDADQAVWRAERDLAEKQRRIAEERRRQRQQLRRELERARDEERRCQEALSAAQPNAQSSARSRLDSASHQVRRAWEALDRFARDRDDAEWAWRELESARERLEAARNQTARARDDEADAERRLDGVQPTTEEPLYAIHRYPVSTWTRRCDATLTLTVNRADAPPRTVELPVHAETIDRAHAVQVIIGLDADPLRFPVDDRTLATRIDAQLAEALRTIVEEERSAWVNGLLTRAQAESAPEERVRLAVGAVLNGGAHATAQRILKEALAVEDPRVLRGE